MIYARPPGGLQGFFKTPLVPEEQMEHLDGWALHVALSPNVIFEVSFSSQWLQCCHKFYSHDIIEEIQNASRIPPFLICVIFLRWANYPQNEFGPVLVNKVLLEHHRAHSLMYCLWLFSRNKSIRK